MSNDQAIQRIADAYARRTEHRRDKRYTSMAWEEVAGYYARYLDEISEGNRSDIRLAEVGCGTGGKLLRLINMGLNPAHMTGVELLPKNAELARERLPQECRIVQGDACSTGLDDESMDVVFQSLVFTSIPTDSMQEKLAAEMWRILKPGGGILWYDFTVNNPRNHDVRGVTRKRVDALFPQAKRTFHRVTLAPPIGRRMAFLGATG